MPRGAMLESQTFGFITMTGPPCGFLTFLAESSHVGRIPLCICSIDLTAPVRARSVIQCTTCSARARPRLSQPKLAQLTLAPADGRSLDGDLSSVPNALHRAYGDAAIPYLESMLERSGFTWVRTGSARELILAGRASGFAFIVDAIEDARQYRIEMIEWLRDRCPELHNADGPTVLAFAKDRATIR